MAGIEEVVGHSGKFYLRVSGMHWLNVWIEKAEFSSVEFKYKKKE